MKTISKLKISTAPGGELSLRARQQNWFGENDVLQTSLFAGQQMMVIQKSDEEPDIYELRYLNFKTVGFKGIQEAKKFAPEFAKAVLDKMSNMITLS